MKDEFLHELRQLARDMGVDLRFFMDMARYYAFTPTQLNEMLETYPDTFGEFLNNYSDYKDFDYDEDRNSRFFS